MIGAWVFDAVEILGLSTVLGLRVFRAFIIWGFKVASQQ